MRMTPRVAATQIAAATPLEIPSLLRLELKGVLEAEVDGVDDEELSAGVEPIEDGEAIVKDGEVDVESATEV
jgi:hypothetical protein